MVLGENTYIFFQIPRFLPPKNLKNTKNPRNILKIPKFFYLWGLILRDILESLCKNIVVRLQPINRFFFIPRYIPRELFALLIFSAQFQSFFLQNP